MQYIDYPPSLSELPRVLYKYRSFDEHGWRMLSELEVFFASPEHFNDPQDTKTPVLYEQGLLKQMYRKNLEGLEWVSGHLSRKERKRQAKEMARTMYRNRNDLERREAYRKATAMEMDSMAGILSLAAARDQTLMWSHYAAGHRGYCLGINSQKLLRFADRLSYQGVQLLLDKVRYYVEPPKLNPYTMTESKIYMTKLFSKSQDWSYEKEYRILCGERPDFALKLPPNLLHSVIFGAKCCEDDWRKAINMMIGKGYNATIEEATFGENGCLQFKLISHLP